MCRGCKHLWEDASVNAFECKVAERLNEGELDKYFADDKDGCPYFEEEIEEDYTI